MPASGKMIAAWRKVPSGCLAAGLHAFMRGRRCCFPGASGKIRSCDVPNAGLRSKMQQCEIYKRYLNQMKLALLRVPLVSPLGPVLRKLLRHSTTAQ